MVISGSNINQKFKIAALCELCETQDILFHIGLALMPVSQELTSRVERVVFN